MKFITSLTHRNVDFSSCTKFLVNKFSSLVYKYIWSLVQLFRTRKFAGEFGEVSIRSWVIMLDGKHKLMLINDQ
jgi:hypothetical protein